MSFIFTIAFTALIALGSAQFSDCVIDGCLRDFESAPQANQYCSSLLGEASAPGFSIYAPVSLPTFAPDCISQIKGVANQIQYGALTSACHCANYPRTQPASTSTSATFTHAWSETTSHTTSRSGSVAPSFPIPTPSSSRSVAPGFPTPTSTPSSSRSVAPGFPTPTSTPSLAPPFTINTNNIKTPLATPVAKNSSSSYISFSSSSSSSSSSSFSSSSRPTTKSNTTTTRSHTRGASIPTTTCVSTITYNSAIYTIPCTATVSNTSTLLRPTSTPTKPTTLPLPLLTASPSGSGVPSPYRNGTSGFQTSTFLNRTSSQPATRTPVGPSGISFATSRVAVFTGAAAGSDSGRAGALLFLAVLGGVVLGL